MLIVRQYNGRFDAIDVQQLIGCLGAHDGGTFQILIGTDGDSKAVVQLRMAHRLGSGLVFGHVVPEHLADTRHICSTSA